MTDENQLEGVHPALGMIGCGNMGRALARGLGEPMLCSDAWHERACALAAELGGEAVESNAQLARRADVVLLCHKANSLREVAAEVAPHARCIVSSLGATPLTDVKRAYPDRPVYRILPSTPVEVRRGAVVLVADEEQDPQLDRDLHELLARLGAVVVLRDELVEVASALMSNAPAYYALIAEAQIDAGARYGIPPEQGATLVAQTMAGAGELLRHRGFDTLTMRREVTSPGGSTARALDALERGGVRNALSMAFDAVMRGR